MNYPGSLHNHTHVSNLRLRDSINKEEELIDYAIELGHSVIAFTEHEALCNAVKIEKYAEKVKDRIKVIRGNEIYLCRNGLNAENFITGQDKYWHFILLAKDDRGHEQIREISSCAWERSYNAHGLIRVPTYYSDLEEIIGKEPGHVIGSSACLGGFLPSKLLQWFTQNNTPEFYKNILSWCKNIQDIFGKNNFYLEMQPSTNQEQIIVNKGFIALANELNLQFIITTDSHYLKKEDRPIHKAYLTSQNGEREVDDFYSSTYMMNTQELESYFDYFDDSTIQKAYATIDKIGKECQDFSLRRPLYIPVLPWQVARTTSVPADSIWFERMPMMRTFYSSSFDGDKLLVEKIIDRLSNDTRLQTQEVYDELNSNLEITWRSSEVNNTHWSAYFLNLQSIIDVCWEAGTLVGCGRGSGVGFLLLYILGITQINPLWEDTKTFSWRFLNPERVSVLDIDVDIEGGRRARILQALRDHYGADKVANVITFGTEGTKASIQTAARGLGIDVDEAYYFSSLVPVDRGKPRTLKQCYYGDEEQGFKPVTLFVQAMDSNPELWKVAQKIEGLVCRMGIHAGGVVFVDEPFTKSTSLMKAPNGDCITAFELHDCEDCSLIKMDLLSVEALDKIHNCLDLLIDQHYIEAKTTLRETYEDTIGIYNLERENPRMWKMIWNHEIQSLFQMEKQSGIQGIALIKPKSVKELAVLNSVIRLMAPTKGAEQPLNMWARYRHDINQWYEEMKNYGLSDEEIEWLKSYPMITDGMAESQESLMALVQEERLGGNSLTFADKCRKGVAKKQGKLFEECQDAFFKTIEEKNCSSKLAHYVWDKLLAVQRGYSFNLSHTLAYSLIALQEMNLCLHYPIVFWNCACLITDSGGNEETGEAGKSTDYNKTAQAMGKMMNEGVKLTLPDINNSSYTFTPQPETNTILYGLKGINRVGEDLVRDIIANRPYTSMWDFYQKLRPNAQAMVQLIKAGVFDNLEPRMQAMVEYIWLTCDKKKRLTLQNLPGLIRNNLLPQDTEEQVTARRIYEFNRYLKSECKYDTQYYKLDDRAVNFLNEMGYEDLIISGSYFALDVKKWDKVYQQWMDIFREWIKSDPQGILDNLNTLIFMQDWNKYGKGNISAWEMEALCFYYHDHELKSVDNKRYGFVDFFSLPEEPVVEKCFKRGNSNIPIFRLNNICGTCIAKNKTKSTVYVLTTTGVVAVKMRQEYFSLFDRQTFKYNEDGTKSVIEKSWFNRGNMIVVQGIRRGDEFIPKKYASSTKHQLYHIDEVKADGSLVLRSDRYGGDEESED